MDSHTCMMINNSCQVQLAGPPEGPPSPGREVAVGSRPIDSQSTRRLGAEIVAPCFRGDSTASPVTRDFSGGPSGRNANHDCGSPLNALVEAMRLCSNP